jgi:hypothetical protein
VRLGGDATGEVFLPRQEPDPASLTRDESRNGEVIG